MTAAVTFVVPGIPVAQGSKRPVRNRSTGRIALSEQLEALGPWRERVAIVAHNAWAGAPLLVDVPVSVECEFVLKRFKNVRANKPTPPAIKRHGDLDKLERAIYDAITGVIINDDSQIVRNANGKRIAELGETCGVTITVKELPWPTTK